MSVTTTSPTDRDLNISLEPHLADTLRPLLLLLPPELASQLTPVVLPSEGPLPNTISYSLLGTISAWARSPNGEESLAAHDPPLRPADYSMIALLAGTRTSPERRFPAHVARGDDAEGRKAYSDRRAVTDVFNALLSIGSSGAATWWAAGRLAWKDEWVRTYCMFNRAVHTETNVRSRRCSCRWRLPWWWRHLKPFSTSYGTRGRPSDRAHKCGPRGLLLQSRRKPRRSRPFTRMVSRVKRRP